MPQALTQEEGPMLLKELHALLQPAAGETPLVVETV